MPAPSGSALRCPACAPLRDPVTVTERNSAGGSEEKMIVEVGEASGVPGNGITCSAVAAVAVALAVSVPKPAIASALQTRSHLDPRTRRAARNAQPLPTV